MNENVNKYIAEINKKMIVAGNQKMSLDVETGKMGYCLYFFKLSRLLNEPQYKMQAEKLLDDIYLELSKASAERSAYELAQIGMGIDYLIKQKYMGGNINAILSDIDGRIFKKMIFDKLSVTYQPHEIIFVLHFICIRIEEQSKGSDERFIMEELGIRLLNDLYRSLDPSFYDESMIFNIQKYKLPQFLYVVSKMYSLQFYNYRIIEIIREISSFVLSRMPVLHSNRLYLLWSLVHLKRVTGWDIWDEQMNMLISHTDYQKIIFKELRNKDVFILDGVASIYLLIDLLKDMSHPIPFDKTLFRKRIEESEIWKDEKFAQSLGLINGFSGLLWVYYSIVYEN